jgi:nucleoside-diphosphate-sugar epimerase
MDWVIASLNLLKSFAENGGNRAVFAGTCFEYDVDYGYLSETLTPLNPKTFYGKMKSRLFELAGDYSDKMGISYAHGRIFYLFGEIEKNNRLMPCVIESMLSGKRPQIKTPRLIRDYMYSGDVAAAFVKLLESDVNGPVNICSGQGVKISDLVSMAARLLDFEIPSASEEKISDFSPPLIGNNERLRLEVDWQPPHSLEDGVRKMIGWYKNMAPVNPKLRGDNDS